MTPGPPWYPPPHFVVHGGFRVKLGFCHLPHLPLPPPNPLLKTACFNAQKYNENTSHPWLAVRVRLLSITCEDSPFFEACPQLYTIGCNKAVKEGYDPAHSRDPSTTLSLSDGATCASLNSANCVRSRTRFHIR